MIHELAWQVKEDELLVLATVYHGRVSDEHLEQRSPVHSAKPTR
jgi:hypothetical protein